MTEYKYVPGISTALMHQIEWHPDWQYATTWAPLGEEWPGRDTPPGPGWVRNVEAGEQGYEQRERTQVSHWRRPKDWPHDPRD